MAKADNQHTMTRRALLRGSMTAAAAATITTVPIAAAAAPPDADPVLEAWRAWRPLEEQAARLVIERDQIWASLPKEAKAPTVLVETPDGLRLRMPSVDQYDRWTGFLDELAEKAGDSNPAEPEISGNWLRGYRRNFLRRFRRAEAKARALIDKSGWTALDNRIADIWDQMEPHESAIVGATATSPVAIAAQLDLGLAHADWTDYLTDLPHKVACGVIRNLLPQLPADMAAALEPIAAERGTILDAYLRGAGGVA